MSQVILPRFKWHQRIYWFSLHFLGTWWINFWEFFVLLFKSPSVQWSLRRATTLVNCKVANQFFIAWKFDEARNKIHSGDMLRSYSLVIIAIENIFKQNINKTHARILHAPIDRRNVNEKCIEMDNFIFISGKMWKPSPI